MADEMTSIFTFARIINSYQKSIHTGLKSYTLAFILLQTYLFFKVRVRAMNDQNDPA